MLETKGAAFHRASVESLTSPISGTSRDCAKIYLFTPLLGEKKEAFFVRF